MHRHLRSSALELSSGPAAIDASPVRWIEVYVKKSASAIVIVNEILSEEENVSLIWIVSTIGRALESESAIGCTPVSVSAISESEFSIASMNEISIVI